MSGLFSSIIQSNSTFLPDTHEVSLCGMKSLSQKSIISWTEGGEVLSVARSVSLFVAIVPYPGRKCNELNRSSGTWCQFSTESVLSLGLTIRSGGGDVLYWAHYAAAGPASQTPQKYTFVHFSQTPGHTVLLVAGVIFLIFLIFLICAAV